MPEFNSEKQRSTINQKADFAPGPVNLINNGFDFHTSTEQLFTDSERNETANEYNVMFEMIKNEKAFMTFQKYFFLVLKNVNI